MRAIFNILGGLLLFVSAALAQAPSISIDVDPHSGSLNDNFIFTVTIEGDQSGAHPYIIGGDDFRLTLLGPSSEISIVNGNVRTRLSYRYRLMPKQAGTLTSPAAEVEIDGKKLSAKSVSVVVSDAPTKPDSAKGSVFLRQSVEKPRLYVGEQSVNTLELYSAVRLLSPQILDLSYDDFAHHEIENDEHTTRFIEGKNFSITRISRAIFPLKTGTLTIPERKVQTRVPTQRSRRLPSFGGLDPFDDDFFGGFLGTTTFEDKVLTSNPLSVEVIPLPDAPFGLPRWNMPSFLVGETTLSVSADPGPVKVGESKTVRVNIESFGNLSPLQHVPLELGSKARVYEESPQLKTRRKGDLLLFSKEFNLSVVPLTEGTLSIPTLELAYFSPVEKTYKRARSAALSFKVIPNPLVKDAPEQQSLRESLQEASASSASQSESASHSAQTSQDAASSALHYREPTLIETVSESVSTGLALMIALGVLILGIIAMVLWGLINASRHSRRVAQEISAATSVENLRTVLLNMISQKHNIGAESIFSSYIDSIKDPDLRFELTSIMDELDRFSFGGLTCGPNELQSLKARVRELQNRL